MATADSICKIIDCGTRVGAHGARGMCPSHYQRFMSTGDPLGRKCAGCGRHLMEVWGRNVKKRRYCGDGCRPRCSVDGCGNPERKRGWCASHYAQWTCQGEVTPFKYKWAEGTTCVVCGAPVIGKRGLRKYCSEGCKVTASRNPGRAQSRACLQCGSEISLVQRYQTGRLQTSRVLLCSECRRRFRRPALTAHEIASRDGAICHICRRDVDMTLKWPDRGSPSVDHVMPLAHGGSESPDNLALAHLRCNAKKQDRIDFTISVT